MKDEKSIVSENSTIDKETLASSQFSNLSRVKFVVGENVHCLYKVPFDHDLLDTMCPEGSMNQAYSQCFFIQISVLFLIRGLWFFS